MAVPVADPFSRSCREILSPFSPRLTRNRNYYLSISRTFQDGNGNGNFEEINSHDFLDGKWGVNGNEGVTASAKTVTPVMVIHPNFKTVTATVILEKLSEGPKGGPAVKGAGVANCRIFRSAVPSVVVWSILLVSLSGVKKKL